MPMPAFPIQAVRRVAPIHRPALTRACAAALLLVLSACQTPEPPAPPQPKPQADATGDRAMPPGAVLVLQKQFPDLHVISRSLGHLQSDDAVDLAAVMAPIGEHGDYVVALLSNTEAPSGSASAPAAAASTDTWRVTAQSVVLNPGCGLCSASVNILQHALFVHVIQAVGADYANVTYQFAYHDSDAKPRLVGVNVYQPEETDDPIPHSYSNSTDMLTGKKLDEIEDSEDDKPRHREVATTVPVRPPIMFDQFAFTADAVDPETRKLPASAFEQSAPLPPRMVKQLEQRYPTLKEQSRASGALREKSGHDVAVVLAPSGDTPKPGAKPVKGAAAAPTTPIIVVMLAQPDGNMQLVAASPPVSRACVGCDVQVLIARRVLTVQMTSTDATSTQIRNYQFAFRPNEGGAGNGTAPQLRLIATRTESVTHTSTGDTRRYVNSANLLTGDKLDVVADIVAGRSRRAERRTHVPQHAPVLLNSFTFDPGALPAETTRDFVMPPEPLPVLPAAAASAAPAASAAAAAAPAGMTATELPPKQ